MVERRDYNPSVLFVHGYVDRVAPAYVYCVDVFERMVGQNFIAARFRKVAVYRVEELALAVESLIRRVRFGDEALKLAPLPRRFNRIGFNALVNKNWTLDFSNPVQ